MTDPYINEDIGKFFYIGMKRESDLFLIDPKITDQVIKRKLKIINLGAGNQKLLGAINFDLPEWDAESGVIPLPDESVGIIHSHHFFEHINNLKQILFECQRVLVKGGSLYITVPHWKGSMAYQDINHVNFFTLDTWKILFANPFYDTRQGDKQEYKWKLKVLFNMVLGVKEENLALCTQMIKG